MFVCICSADHECMNVCMYVCMNVCCMYVYGTCAMSLPLPLQGTTDHDLASLQATWDPSTLPDSTTPDALTQDHVSLLGEELGAGRLAGGVTGPQVTSLGGSALAASPMTPAQQLLSRGVTVCGQQLLVTGYARYWTPYTDKQCSPLYRLKKLFSSGD